MQDSESNLAEQGQTKAEEPAEVVGVQPGKQASVVKLVDARRDDANVTDWFIKFVIAVREPNFHQHLVLSILQAMPVIHPALIVYSVLWHWCEWCQYVYEHLFVSVSVFYFFWFVVWAPSIGITAQTAL